MVSSVRSSRYPGKGHGDHEVPVGPQEEKPSEQLAVRL